MDRVNYSLMGLKYNSMLTYIPVSFFQKRVRVMVKNRVRVTVSFRVRLGFGIGNLIGGAAGTVGSALARRLSAITLHACTRQSAMQMHGCRHSVPLRITLLYYTIRYAIYNLITFCLQ